MNAIGVVLAAGEGSRLRPITYTIPKPLISVLGKPLALHIIDTLRSSGLSRFVFVVDYLGGSFMDVIGDGSRFGVDVRYVTQGRRLGIAHAIYRVVEEGLSSGSLVVHLGDNYFSEDISPFVRAFLEGGYDAFVVLTRHRDPTRFGYVLVEDRRIVRLIEKPRDPPPGGYTLTGLYMFRDPDLVARAFKTLRPSARGEYEITDMIQWFVDNNHRVGYAITSGWWKDTGTPDDLIELVYLMLDRIEPRVEGEIRGEASGRLIVERGAIIEGRVHGPVYIGSGAYIGRNSTVEHYVDIEAGSSIDGGSLSRCLVLNSAALRLGDARLVDSIIGPRSRVELRSGRYRLIVGEGNIVHQDGG